MRRATTVGATLAALAMVVAGCAPDAPAAGDGGRAGEEVQLAHSQCMRDRGYDWPDPTWVDGSWDLHFGPENEIDFESPQVERDDAACQAEARKALGDDAPAAPPDHDAVEAEMEQLLEFAACMREQGIDYPDPVLDDQGNISNSVEIADAAAFQAAEQACDGGSER